MSSSCLLNLPNGRKGARAFPGDGLGVEVIISTLKKKKKDEPGMQEDMGTLRSLVDLQYPVVEDLEPWVDLGLPRPPGKVFRHGQAAAP